MPTVSINVHQWSVMVFIPVLLLESRTAVSG